MLHRTLTITLGGETRPVVEKIKNDVQLEDLFFNEQYVSVFSAIDKYLEEIKDKSPRSKKQKKDVDDNVKDKRTNEDEDDIKIENDNNIFAFSGDRGSGKTSCMMSVATALVKKEYDFKPKWGHIAEKDFYMITPQMSSPLNISDPSFFDESHNIIQLIIAQMHKAFTAKVKEDIKHGEDEHEALRNKLLHQFSLVHKYLVQQTKKIKDDTPEDGIEMFSCYSASISLQEEIHNLVDSYLSFMYEDGNGILVIPIDDIDLHSTHAVEMMELIRKYFITNNILVLMSVKLDQLTMLKRQQNIKDYKELLEKEKITLDEIDSMTERYISKLIPLSQRVYMPEAEVWHYSRLIICKENKDSTLGKYYKKKVDVIDEFETVRVGILELVYRITNYLFYNTDVHTCYLVPKNLRELRQLIRMLEELEPITNEQEAKNAIHNQTVFKKYLSETWAESHLTAKDRERINSLLGLNDVARFNAVVLNLIREKYSKSESDEIPSILFSDEILNQKENPESFEIYYIFNPTNRVYNISLGDIAGIISILEQEETNERNLNFLFFMKALYSIRLYEYCQEYMNKDNTGTVESTILATTFKSGLSHADYHRMIGGKFINYRLYDVLPKERNRVSRTSRKIDANILQTKLKEISSKYETGYAAAKKNANGTSNVQEIAEKGGFDALDEYMDKNQNTVWLLEFFMLCVSRLFDTKNKNKDEDYYDPAYRNIADVVSNKSIVSGTKNVLFDLGSFFYNITRIEECYKRFGKGGEILYKYAQQDQKHKTLFSEIRKKEGEQQGICDEREWLSKVAIRNMDVLWNIVHKINNIDGNSDNRIVLSDYFDALAKNVLNVYGESQQTSKSMDFTFCTRISAWLKNLDKPSQNMFDKIYKTIKSKPSTSKKEPVIQEKVKETTISPETPIVSKE